MNKLKNNAIITLISYIAAITFGMVLGVFVLPNNSNCNGHHYEESLFIEYKSSVDNLINIIENDNEEYFMDCLMETDAYYTWFVLNEQIDNL